ncbi:MAG: hypothetical protein ACK6BC_00160 [Cyanobacteriota bacterium]|jgi:hypothetical protein
MTIPSVPESRPRPRSAAELAAFVSPSTAQVAEMPPSTDEANQVPPAIARWVKSECGQAKYLELARQRGPGARLRRWWFVLIAALRDWRLPPPAVARR